MARRVVMVKSIKATLILISVLACMEISPVQPQVWRYEQENLIPDTLSGNLQIIPTLSQADLDQDLQPEYLNIYAGHLAICSTPGCSASKGGENAVLWKTPHYWRVTQAEFTDINRDNKPEISMIVWRPFTPWPIDRYLPDNDRILSFHDASGQSCHLILIGWQRGKFKELWAGSALVNPLNTFTAVDLNRDGLQELVTLESKYNRSLITPAWSLSVWEWNGFGFSRLAGVNGHFRSISVYEKHPSQIYLINQ